MARSCALSSKFKGKSGKTHSISVRDRRLARIVRRCQELPGQELFEYVDDDGARHLIDSSDVNEYLQEIRGDDFTAKDFRTWAGTTLAAAALQEMEPGDTLTARKHNMVEAIKEVAGRLGNTPLYAVSAIFTRKLWKLISTGRLPKA